MAHSIRGSVGSWESGAKNTTGDIRTVQQLLTDVAKKKGNRDFDPRGVDGKIHRAAGRSGTVKAIVNFQRKQVKMSRPDARVDVEGRTWKALVAAAGKGLARAPGLFVVTFAHAGKIPKHTDPKSATYQGLYESRVTVSGDTTGVFRGSIYPDDMAVKGRLKDGTYPLHIGFHKGGSASKQKQSDLIVRTKNIRSGLLVNARNGVSVISDNPNKTTSYGVNVHNGFNSQRYSDGCPTIRPSDWTKFIQIFLDAYPNIDDWHAIGNNTGKKIGKLIVKE